MQNAMGTQFRFTLQDTNRDGAPVPDVFVTGNEGNPRNAEDFYDFLRRESKDFATHVATVAEQNVNRGRGIGQDAVLGDIVEWYKENSGDGFMREPTVAELIADWDLKVTRTFTVTVSFDDVEGELTVTGVEADDEEDACQQVSETVGAEWSLNYDGPGEIDSDPFADSTIYIGSVEAEEEE